MSTTTTTVTLINAFEVRAEADEPFIAGWERARDFLATRDGFSRTALHRALRRDAAFRFVNVARVDSPEAWQRAIADPAFPGGKMPFPAHPGLYDVVHEDGELDGDGVVLINAFEVPPDADEPFIAGWNGARELLAAQPGYLGTRLHRSLGGNRLPLRQHRALVEPAGLRHRHRALGFPAGGYRRAVRVASRPVRGHP
jgi:heme-degrading monooxygenase HmoA